MLKPEAEWIGTQLTTIDSSVLTPLLDIGSSPSDFREKVQPYISADIFAPLIERGVDVVHSDIQNAPGIDRVGDLNDNAFIDDLKGCCFRSALFCNVLEHVTEPRAIAEKVESIITVGGYIIVTVPNRFPYHPDPIDTMFRPDVNGIVAIFPQCRLVSGAIVNCGTGWDYIGHNPLTLVKKVASRLMGGRHGGAKGSASFGLWLFRQFRVTCVILQKTR